MATAQEESKTPKPKKEKAPAPSKVGDVDNAGYKVEGVKDNRMMIMTLNSKFGVYENAYTKDEKCILRPTKDREVAESVLATGEKPEKPKKEPKEPKKPKEPKVKGELKGKAPKPEK